VDEQKPFWLAPNVAVLSDRISVGLAIALAQTIGASILTDIAWPGSIVVGSADRRIGLRNLQTAKIVVSRVLLHEHVLDLRAPLAHATGAHDIASLEGLGDRTAANRRRRPEFLVKSEAHHKESREVVKEEEPRQRDLFRDVDYCDERSHKKRRKEKVVRTRHSEWKRRPGRLSL
jgi:hypothetical protein